VSFTFFTDRLGGYSQGDFSSLNLALHVDDDSSTVMRNRDLIDKDYGKTVYMNQVHGNAVEVIDEHSGITPTCDALVTTAPGITLAVMTADCIPLLLSSDAVIGAAHVGRRGLLNGVAEKTIQVMRDLGALKITAHIGPAICGRCYEVDENTFTEVVTQYPRSASTTRQGTRALDLTHALVAELELLSVTSTVDSRCTMEESDLFSYRKSHRTGRQAGLIRL
jgi:YfiH family protein